MAEKIERKGRKIKPTIKPKANPLRKRTPLKRPGEVKHGVRGEPDRPPPPPLLPDI